MTDDESDLEVLAPSRRRLRTGDVFTFKLRGGPYLFGRVVSTDATWTQASGAGPANLVYIYRWQSDEPAVPPASEMRPDCLLLPPILINRLGWSRGYLETLATVELGPGDTLPVHCFERTLQRPTRYFDQHGHELDGPVEPVGELGLYSYAYLGHRAVQALAAPLPQVRRWKRWSPFGSRERS